MGGEGVGQDTTGPLPLQVPAERGLLTALPVPSLSETPILTARYRSMQESAGLGGWSWGSLPVKPERQQHSLRKAVVEKLKVTLVSPQALLWSCSLVKSMARSCTDTAVRGQGLAMSSWSCFQTMFPRRKHEIWL